MLSPSQGQKKNGEVKVKGWEIEQLTVRLRCFTNCGIGAPVARDDGGSGRRNQQGWIRNTDGQNKGDDENPALRSRFVGKEFNDGPMDGLFAGMPPLEALRSLISEAATLEDGGEEKIIEIDDAAPPPPPAAPRSPEIIEIDDAVAPAPAPRTSEGWVCRTCTRAHTSAKERPFLACAACGAIRPPEDDDE